jgi:hypothetical protein
MLRAATPLPAISAVLGHATDCTSQYMNVDNQNLLRPESVSRRWDRPRRSA